MRRGFRLFLLVLAALFALTTVWGLAERWETPTKCSVREGGWFTYRERHTDYADETRTTVVRDIQSFHWGAWISSVVISLAIVGLMSAAMVLERYMSYGRGRIEGIRYRTVCDSTELPRLLALQRRVNDRPLEGIGAGTLMFLLDNGKQLTPTSVELFATLSPVTGQGAKGQYDYRSADLSFLTKWERLPD